MTAVDWSKNVFKREKEHYHHDIIQVVRKVEPETAPYRDRNGIVIIETKEIKDFFSELTPQINDFKKTLKDREAVLKGFIEELNDPDKKTIEKFIDKQLFRNRILFIISDTGAQLASGFINFLSKCIDETWERAQEPGNFEPYDQNLKIILDILIDIEFKKMPPALFSYLVYSLDRVASYVDSEGRGHLGRS